MRALPRSLVFFLVTGIVMLLQMIPIVGIFLMVMLAMFWSVLLINAGMIGIIFEAATHRVSRWWLVLPTVFYGGYYAVALSEHIMLARLGASYQAANSTISIPFDYSRQVLVLRGDNWGDVLVTSYGLPLQYEATGTTHATYRSIRLAPRPMCARIEDSDALIEAGFRQNKIYDGSGLSLADRTVDARVCVLTAPGGPKQPTVTAERLEERDLYGSMPIKRVRTFVRAADGGRFELLGGRAAPLSWFPLPVFGCALVSSVAEWQCDALFWRNIFTPILPGRSYGGPDTSALAKSLGLMMKAPGERQPYATRELEAQMLQAEQIGRKSASRVQLEPAM